MQTSYFNKSPEEIIGKLITDFMPDAKISDVIKTQKPIYAARHSNLRDRASQIRMA